MKKFLFLFVICFLFSAFNVNGQVIRNMQLPLDENRNVAFQPVSVMGYPAGVTTTNSNTFICTPSMYKLVVDVNGCIDTITLPNSRAYSIQELRAYIDSKKVNNLYTMVAVSKEAGTEIYDQYLYLFTDFFDGYIQVLPCPATGAETALGFDTNKHYAIAPQISLTNQTYLNTFIIGVGAKVNFPDTRLSTETYSETRWVALSSTYIDSSYVQIMGAGIKINTVAAHVLGSLYCSGTITFAVFDRGTTNTWLPTYFVLTAIDSRTGGVTVDTITYSYSSGSTNPPTGDWTSMDTNTRIWNADNYVQVRAVLSTSDSVNFSPRIQWASVNSGGHYTCGFKIYNIFVTQDNAIDSQYFDIDDGPHEQIRFMNYIKAGTSFCPTIKSPIVIDDTCTIHTGSGMYLRFEYMPK